MKPPAVTPKQSSSTVLYVVMGVLLAVLLIGTAGIMWFSGSGPGRSMVGGPFALVTGDNKPVTEKDFRGKYLLVYFGYTFCPDVCPTTLNTVADALEKLGPKADKIQTVFITVDPKRDTPDAVKQYAAAFSPKFIGLTGTPAQIEAAAKAYRVYYKEHRTGPGPNDYSMDHSSILYLMNPDGVFVAPVRAEQPPAEMAAALNKLVP